MADALEILDRFITFSEAEGEGIRRLISLLEMVRAAPTETVLAATKGEGPNLPALLLRIERQKREQADVLHQIRKGLVRSIASMKGEES